MYYDQKYPHAKEGNEVTNGMLKVANASTCHVCNHLTTFADLDFHTAICSEECSDKIWEDYTNALKGE